MTGVQTCALPIFGLRRLGGLRLLLRRIHVVGWIHGIGRIPGLPLGGIGIAPGHLGIGLPVGRGGRRRRGRLRRRLGGPRVWIVWVTVNMDDMRFSDIEMALASGYRAALYCRLSKDDDQEMESASIANQRAMLQQYCAKNGWEVVAVYQDDGYTGLNMEDRKSVV